MSTDTPKCPPSIIFDAVYADAVVHHFAAHGLDKDWESVMTAAQACRDGNLEQKIVDD
jgi:hypothetical protein